MSEMSELLNIDSITLSYGNGKEQKTVVENFSLNLEQGSIMSLLGNSGCGKTTVLRSVAGFEKVKAGSITLNQQVLSSTSIHIQPENRRIGMMFQDYALFPHLTVTQNIAFGLNKWNKKLAKERVQEMLDLIQLADLAERRPHEISGGQQQRVALARAIAPAPQLLLLDEPFSNLDTNIREHLAIEIRNILKNNNLSAILVTHNHCEAKAMADKIVHM